MTTEETTTFEDLDDTYGNLIEKEIDNDMKDFMWLHNLSGVSVDVREDNSQ